MNNYLPRLITKCVLLPFLVYMYFVLEIKTWLHTDIDTYQSNCISLKRYTIWWHLILPNMYQSCPMMLKRFTEYLVNVLFMAVMYFITSSKVFEFLVLLAPLWTWNGTWSWYAQWLPHVSHGYVWQYLVVLHNLFLVWCYERLPL